MSEESDLPWRVTDLKQYSYCPRVLYYHACLPHVRPTTYRMEASHEAHEAAEGLEERRSLRSYGLKEGERHFHVRLASERLGLRGEVDMVIETGAAGNRELIPVDYKLSDRVADHFQLQLAAYAVMLEDGWGLPARRGFLYLIPLREARPVAITARLRGNLDEALAVMQGILRREEMPAATRQRAKCIGCEFRRFCNDVL